MIDYARQTITRADIRAVGVAMQSPFLTTGPAVRDFEAAVADYCGARYAVAVANGTAALHVSCLALGLQAGDRHWTSPISFAASSNCGIYCGSQPGFVDIDPSDYTMDTEALATQLQAAARQNRLPKVVIPVHFAGLPCAMPAIHRLAKQYGFRVIEDACHALGADYCSAGRRYRVGSCRHSDLAVFSFHAVKNLTTGEGGMILTNQRQLYDRMVRIRSHGITRRRGELSRRNQLPYYYEMRELGYNYRITDLQCALGLSQLARLDRSNEARRKIAHAYRTAFAGLPGVTCQAEPVDRVSACHLFVIRGPNRDGLYRFLLRSGIRGNLHYIPIYRHPYYQRRYALSGSEYPQAETYYRNALTLPLYPGLLPGERKLVIRSVRDFYA